MSAQLITQGAGAGLGISVTVALPPFPNVPLLPGVPQLARPLIYPPSAPPAITTEATQGVLWQSTAPAAVWGVFDSDNNLVVDADAVQDFNWRQEYRVSNFPIQNGAFASYNKVILPFEASIILTKGGTLSERNTFLAQIDDIVASLSLYKIVTPEKTYLSINPTRAELSRRSAANAAYFDVELFFTQIVQVSAQYSIAAGVNTDLSNSSTPSAVPSVGQGVNNATTPTSAVQTQAIAAITPPVPTS